MLLRRPRAFPDYLCAEWTWSRPSQSEFAPALAKVGSSLSTPLTADAYVMHEIGVLAPVLLHRIDSSFWRYWWA